MSSRFIRNIALGAVLLVCACVTSHAQTVISGWIKDEIGEPLAGAVVMVKGTQTAAVADEDGNYSITIPAGIASPVLVYNFMGFTDIEKTIGRTKRINVVMEESVDTLNESVVVGFGTQERATVTGSMSDISGEDLEDVPTGDATNALMGRIAGLISMQGSGMPGEDEGSIYIRGEESENGSAPLVLVDGVERSLSQVPAEDILSISVLKDASATAVYGVRGANGVILVTTRRGRSGKARISFSAQNAITTYTRMQRWLDAETTSRLMREGCVNHGIDPSGKTETTWYYGVSEYDNYLYRTQQSPFSHPDNDFVELFTKNGHQQTYNMSISGGAPSLRYYVSMNYYSQQGMFDTDVEALKQKEGLKKYIDLVPELDDYLQAPDYDSSYNYRRLSTRANLDIALTRRLQVKVNVSYSIGNQNRPGASDAGGSYEGSGILRMAYRNSPQRFSIINADGTMGGGKNAWRQNPLMLLCYCGFSRSNNSRLQDNIQFTLNLNDFINGLTMTGNFSYDASWSSSWGVSERPAVYWYNSDEDSYEQGMAQYLPSRSANVSAVSFNTYGELALRYRKSFEQKHNISVNLLGTYNSKNNASGGTYAYIPQIYKSLIGRFNYNYQYKYLFEVNAGYNGSNRFAKGHRYHLFPSVSSGWVFSNEPWMENIKDILGYGKIRASFGTVGSDNIGSFSFYYLDSYTGGKSYSFGETWHSQTGGLQEGAPSNPILGWEQSNKFNVGLETKWLKQALEFKADYFFSRRHNILTRTQNYSITSGLTDVAAENYGITSNRGFELELNFNGRTKDGNLSYYAYTNCSYARNRIERNGEAVQPYDYMYSRGHSNGQLKGYHCLGLFQSYEEIAASPQQFGLQNLMPGDLKYADLNQDGVVDQNDVSIIGFSSVPRFSYGITLGGKWKRVDFKVLFQGATQCSINLYGDVAWDNSAGNYFSEHLARWTPETAATATYPRLNYRALEQNQNYFTSDFWVTDSSYLRFKNASIGYTFNRDWLRKIRLYSARVYVNAFNIYTWDKVKKVDPESRHSNGEIYPQQKVFNAGINIGF